MPPLLDALETPSLIPPQRFSIQYYYNLKINDENREMMRQVKVYLSAATDRLAAAILARRISQEDTRLDNCVDLQISADVDLEGHDHGWKISVVSLEPEVYGHRFGIFRSRIPQDLVADIDLIIARIGDHVSQKWRSEMHMNRSTMRLEADWRGLSNHARLELETRSKIPIRDLLKVQSLGQETA